MAFLKEAEPVRGVALPVLPGGVDGVTRIVAPNPSVMTCHGTNTYLIEDGAGGLSVLDPGPDDAGHIAAIVQAGAGRIRRILISHAHGDHFRAARPLQALLDVPVVGWQTSCHRDFTADVSLHDREMVAGLRVLHTPGHAFDHICFEWRDGIVFTADHVMGWSSSIVSPPDGDMADYCVSLELMLTRPHTLYLCGHGPAVGLGGSTPDAYVRSLLAHRMSRERAIAYALSEAPASSFALMDRLYSKIDPWLRLAAERNVIAHLNKLMAEGRVEPRGELWHWLGGAVS